MDEKSNARLITSSEIENTRFESLKLLVEKFLDENIIELGNKPASWAKKVIENNIVQLKKYLDEIESAAYPSAIFSYIKDELKFQNGPNSTAIDNAAMSYLHKRMRESSLYMNAARHCYQYSVVYDMYWFSDGNVMDHFQVAMGSKNISFLTDLCDDKINKIKQHVFPFLNSRSDYHLHSRILEETCSYYKSRSFISTNMVLNGVIEGIVTIFASFLYQAQNPGISMEQTDQILQKHHSLNALINNVNWKNDAEISIAQAIILSRYINDGQLEKAISVEKEQLLLTERVDGLQRKLLEIANAPSFSGEDIKPKMSHLIAQLRDLARNMKDLRYEKISISLKVQFEFLLRRYKDNRNALMHGDFDGFDQKWYSYVNLTAICKVVEIIKRYDSFYDEDER